MLGISPEIVLFGLGVGILIGLTGIGGGSLMTPLLIIVLGVQPVVAIGTDLMYGAITKTLGGYRHLRKGTVDLTVSKWLAFGSVPGALLGVLLVDRLHKAYAKEFDQVLLGCVAAALLMVATVVLVRTFLLRHLAAGERETFTFTTRTKAAAIVLGFVLGTILGLTSVGSGALIGVALIVLFRLTPKRVVGTDVFHAALLLWVAGTANVISGHVDYGLMGNILIGSIPGVWIGTHFIDRVPTHALRVTLGAVLLGSALAMVKNAGGHMPVGVIFGVPVAVGVVGWLLSGARPAWLGGGKAAVSGKAALSAPERP
ncbi:MAG TPA: sulfite exporter TauE/SafE family protein [Solirubrobacteraceae bacterium]|jgi:hypothetical protein|nr:sulfite exporter TauE/SafE family protein [Solirubrobacteraceae bacterium]